MAAGDVSCALTRPLAKKCYVFDGVDDGIKITSKKFFCSEKVWSVSVWFYAKEWAFTDEGRIISHTETTTNNRVYLHTLIGGGLGFTVGSTTSTAKNAGEWTLNQWHHGVIIRYKETGKKSFYLDGVLIDNKSAATIGSNVPNEFYIGRLDTTEFFNGGIRDLRIYERELSQTDVINLYNGLDLTDNLIAHWPLTDDTNDRLGISNGILYTGGILTSLDDDVKAVLKAARAGATDKYMAVEANGQILTAVIAES